MLLLALLQDKRLAWFDMDLSTKPYRIMRYHTSALTGVAFHRTYPLFASSSTDASAHVFHGMVYQVGHFMRLHHPVGCKGPGATWSEGQEIEATAASGAAIGQSISTCNSRPLQRHHCLISQTCSTHTDPSYTSGFA